MFWWLVRKLTTTGREPRISPATICGEQNRANITIKEDAIRTGPGRISSHCDIICTEASPGRISSRCDVICTGASPGRISSHCDVICTGPGPGGITRANKFTSSHYLHGGITGQTIHMRGQDMSYYSRAHGGPRLFSMGAAPGQILSRALHEPTHACKWQYGARDIFIYICIVTNHEQCIP